MKIAILSDTHNQIERTRRALDLARRHGAAMVLHCGDIEEPPVVELFRGWDAHFVLGNCDWSPDALAQAIADIGATLHDRFGHVEVEGVKIAFTHGHHSGLLTDLQQSGAYDYLFHGHTHVAADRLAGSTRVINPGALHRAAVKTFVVLDTATGVARSVEVG
jgi:uncharacterized protein